jgi:hypothetical protein
MKFGELKKGDSIYCVVVKNSEIVDGEIKPKQIIETRQYLETRSIEIHTSDGASIMPRNEDEYVIKGLATLSNLVEPFNFTIYATSYDICYEAIRKIVSTKITQLGEDFKKINVQMSRLCLMSSVVRDMAAKSHVVAETVYAD